MSIPRTTLPLLFLVTTLVTAQETAGKYWIFFRDKGESSTMLLKSSQELARSIGISERALTRRAKVLPPGKLISGEDLPVSRTYCSAIQQRGITILNESRWFNAVSAMLTGEERKTIVSLPFVVGIEPVRTHRGKLPPLKDASRAPNIESSIAALHDYGPSFTQVNQIGVVDVHNVRVTGRGVLVGMLDSGFRWKIPEATKGMNIVAEYDFIQKDSVTANQTGDAGNQDSHGTITLSTLGGHKEGKLVSPAFGASFILAKTEYVPTETNVEEDNWVAGIEWEEQNGADVVSSSLGYSEFDPGQHSYTYQDMNGRTATTTRAAVIAARKGVVVANAMGNEALSSWHYLTSPADADSILSVGAVTSSGSAAWFSSVGPTSDGRTKPDVVAQGVATYASTVSNSNPSETLYGYNDGTSLSTPLVAGAAALVLSAHPELTPVQVRDALRNTASNASSPNNSIGWGVINAYKAILYHGMILSTDPEIATTPDSNYKIGMFVVSNAVVKKEFVRLSYSINGGSSFSELLMALTTIVDTATNSGKYEAVIPHQETGTAIKFYASAVDATEKIRMSPYGAPSSVYQFTAGLTVVGIGSLPTAFALYQNYPNPFNSVTTIRYSLGRRNPVTLQVYDLLGRRAAVLVDQTQDAGMKSITFNASGLPSGAYFYRLQSGKFVDVKRLLFVK